MAKEKANYQIKEIISLASKELERILVGRAALGCTGGCMDSCKTGCSPGGKFSDTIVASDISPNK